MLPFFCEGIRAAGYIPGVYANSTWWEKYLTSSRYDQWERWVAQYNSQLNYSRPYSIWQYSDKGTVNGIHGPVDMNYWYGEAFGTGCIHNYTSVIVPELGCTIGGRRIRTCLRCGEQKEDIVSECVSSFFKDTPSYSDWSHEGIDYVISDGIFFGKGDNCFDPQGAMTRAMAVTVLWRVAGCPQPAQRCSFIDVESDAWYADAVAWAEVQGLVNGVGDGCFNPSGAVTREQFATMLYRRRAEGTHGEVPEDILRLYSDTDQISDYALEELSWCVHKGYINGMADDGIWFLNPQGIVTRAQAATILYRLPK